MPQKPFITALLALVAEFPKRGRVQYDDPRDQEFVTQVLVALKKAGPDIIVLHQDVETLTAEHHRLNQLIVDIATQVADTGGTITEPLFGPLVRTAAEYVATTRFLSDVTTQSRSPEATAQTPSSDASPAPEAARNNHTPAVTPSKDGTVSKSDRKSGSAGKLASLNAKKNAARAAGGKRTAPALTKAEPAPNAIDGAVPHAAPPATGGTGDV